MGGVELAGLHHGPSPELQQAHPQGASVVAQGLRVPQQHGQYRGGFGEAVAGEQRFGCVQRGAHPGEGRCVVEFHQGGRAQQRGTRIGPQVSGLHVRADDALAGAGLEERGGGTQRDSELAQGLQAGRRAAFLFQVLDRAPGHPGRTGQFALGESRTFPQSPQALPDSTHTPQGTTTTGCCAGRTGHRPLLRVRTNFP